MQSRSKILLYAHPACPQLAPVKMLLDQNNVDYEYINIYQNHDARLRVKEINNGYESVPTLEFADGSTLTEPAISDLRHKLESYGYEIHISLATRLMDKWGIILIIAAMIFAILRALGVF